MAHSRRAVIDVGTNSVKVLVADVDGRDIRPVLEDSKQTRLGAGFYESRRLLTEPIAYSANAVADFARLARAHGAGSVRVIATSAARDAVNSEELISAVEAAAKLRVEIISGDQEAEWVFQGVTTDPALAGQPLLLLEVGGGSTEFILGQGEHKDFSACFPLGSVRLLEAIPHSDPPRPEEFAACQAWLVRFLSNEVQSRLQTALQAEARLHPSPGRVLLVGTGGTTSILARIEAGLASYDRARIEATRLGFDRLRWHLERLWSLPLAERRQIVGLPKRRADVILTGAAIYAAVMEMFAFSELRVSTRGLRFGAVMESPR